MLKKKFFIFFSASGRSWIIICKLQFFFRQRSKTRNKETTTISLCTAVTDVPRYLGQVNSVKSRLDERLCGCQGFLSFSLSLCSSFSRRPLVRLICLRRSSQLDAYGKPAFDCRINAANCQQRQQARVNTVPLKALKKKKCYIRMKSHLTTEQRDVAIRDDFRLNRSAHQFAQVVSTFQRDFVRCVIKWFYYNARMIKLALQIF